MRAMIWKELRENFKWAALAMLALGGAELYGLYQTRLHAHLCTNKLCGLCISYFTSLGPRSAGYRQLSGFYSGVLIYHTLLFRDQFAAQGGKLTTFYSRFGPSHHNRRTGGDRYQRIIQILQNQIIGLLFCSSRIGGCI